MLGIEEEIYFHKKLSESFSLTPKSFTVTYASGDAVSGPVVRD